MGEARHVWDGEEEALLLHHLPHDRHHLRHLEPLRPHRQVRRKKVVLFAFNRKKLDRHFTFRVCVALHLA